MEEQKKKVQSHCAACGHCVVFRRYNGRNQYVLRIKCGAKHWNARSGKETTYDYAAVLRRRMFDCPDYAPTCATDAERHVFLKELQRQLPLTGAIHKEDE